jgi:hypothetical protein
MRKTLSNVIITNQELEDICLVLKNFGLIQPSDESYSKAEALKKSLYPILDKNLDWEDAEDA